MKRLLADPVVTQPKLRILRERRNWLAHQGGAFDAYLKVAEEFEKLGAYYPAVELLWFAEKMTDLPETREALNERMRAMLAKAEQANVKVDAAAQMWAAGRTVESLKQLHELTVSHPYCEKAHYERGYRSFLGYLTHDEESEGKLPADVRTKMFRVCYTSFLKTIEIDPLYNDAYYNLSQIRELLSDNDEFLKRTERLTERAAYFQSEVVPAVSKIEDGDRSTGALVRAGDRFHDGGLYAYAVFAYHAALVQSGGLPELTDQIHPRIKKILSENIPK